MLNPYDNETEEQNNFWSDVYKFMQDTGCTKEEAIKEMELLYSESIEDMI